MPIIVNDRDTHLSLTHLSELNQLKTIPPMVYAPQMTPNGPILEKLQLRFKVPKKVYGHHTSYMAEITSEYERQTKSTGVILSGLKGAGKTLLAEALGNYILDTKRCILQITTPIDADTLKMFIKIVGPCMVFFDEFGKVYHDEKMRKSMLTLFSDSQLEKILFVVTANGWHELDEFMVDRPGRFRFRIDYEGMKEEAMAEMMEDIPMSPEVKQYVQDYTTYHSISFDMLATFLEILRANDTVEKIRKAGDISNIPRNVHCFYKIKEIQYKGEEYLGTAVMETNDDGSVLFKMIDKTNGNLTEEAKIDWLNCNRTSLEKGGNTFLVVIRPDLTVTVQRSVTAFKLGGNSKFDGSKSKRQRERRDEYGDNPEGYDPEAGGYGGRPYPGPFPN